MRGLVNWQKKMFNSKVKKHWNVHGIIIKCKQHGQQISLKTNFLSVPILSQRTKTKNILSSIDKKSVALLCKYFFDIEKDLKMKKIKKLRDKNKQQIPLLRSERMGNVWRYPNGSNGIIALN